MRLYVGRPRHLGIGRFIQSMRAKLNDWFDSLPAEIKLDTALLQTYLPAICSIEPARFFSTAYSSQTFSLPPLPPPSTSCTRPREPVPQRQRRHRLLGLYSKSFVLQNMTYIMTWSIYSAANINEVDFLGNDTDITAPGARLSMSMYVLEQCIPQMPGTKRSIEILKYHHLPRPRSIASTKHGISRSFPESSSVADVDEDGARKLRRPRSTSIQVSTTTAQQRESLLEDAQMCLSSIIDSAPSTDSESLLRSMSSSHAQQTEVDISNAAAPLALLPSYSGQKISFGSEEDQIQSWIRVDTAPLPTEECPAGSSKAAQPQTYPETDDWGTLYSLLTVQDVPDVDTMFAANGLEQTDLSQGVMAVPSFVESEVTGHQIDPWAAFFDENME
ncbi:hypothetical protein PFICI_11806 [Pestalotiopsis fici W106-1]|uniref:Uncharacterized protein n=1 Tax=Pestalotiopsis fici (strain W106-1 / CGMCC3.15140) TaxID=1229662 RepID=W3WRF4_PESFW|nr:uncharacterized protein PFICI_11806 [Pestalotiopsis fici W106-1]ETS76419.1 hypothetical protein PFICI_11806 [Pestalotiopsis fici W106-1]